LGATAKKMNQGELLFKEGDTSEAMYVVKKGRLSVFKVKGKGEIELAQVGPGQMFGEMAFFDAKPRSASVKALEEVEIIELPFQALQSQFKSFPEWLKAMIKTINDHLRDANARIRSLEQANNDSRAFPPHVMTKLCAIINLIAAKFGQSTTDDMVVIPSGTLRRYTIQVFQEPTNKMQKLIDQLCGLGIMKLEDLGEGKIKTTLLKPTLLHEFVEYYNEYLFTETGKKVTIEEDELKLLRGLIHFGSKMELDANGAARVSLTHIQNESMKELTYVLTTNDFNGLVNKKLVGEPESSNGELFIKFEMDPLQKLLSYWEIVYTLERVQR